jgi:hypothetical protein
MTILTTSSHAEPHDSLNTGGTNNTDLDETIRPYDPVRESALQSFLPPGRKTDPHEYGTWVKASVVAEAQYQRYPTVITELRLRELSRPNEGQQQDAQRKRMIPLVPEDEFNKYILEHQETLERWREGEILLGK